MVEDITDRRQAQTALMHAERLTLAGKLAASLAHEINNPLQSIIGCVGLAEEAAEAGESPAEYLALARSELRRVANMVGRMRDLHRSPDMERRRATRVNGLLEEVLALSRRQCDEQGIRVRRQFGRATPPVLAATDQMRQVFLYLVLNAIEAMPAGGNLVVRSESTSDRQGVRVTFADDGAGIEPDVLPHIFKAFYSTKDGGTGIGLAITRDIVQRHGGYIEVQSELGQGSTFSIWLPALVQNEEGPET
jgi:signal transduction histidine kinase